MNFTNIFSKIIHKLSTNTSTVIIDKTVIVNGKKINPDSAEAKRITKTIDEGMNKTFSQMDKTFKEMEKMFEKIF